LFSFHLHSHQYTRGDEATASSLLGRDATTTRSGKARKDRFLSEKWIYSETEIQAEEGFHDIY